MAQLKNVTGLIKARDIDHAFKTLGFEAAVRKYLPEMAEQQRALEHTQTLCAQALDQMTDLIMQFSDVAGRLKESHQDLVAKMQGNDRPDLPSARGE